MLPKAFANAGVVRRHLSSESMREGVRMIMSALLAKIVGECRQGGDDMIHLADAALLSAEVGAKHLSDEL
eukprot:13809349-Heterocapsa_arctica.AAC.1